MPISEACKKLVSTYYENLKILKEAPDLTPGQKQVAQVEMTKGLKQPGWQDKIAEFTINSYISGIQTPLVNAYSVFAKAPLLIAERALIAAMPGTKAKLGEVIPMAAGMLQGAAESLQLAKAGFLKGFPLDQDPTADIVRKAIGGQEGASAAEKIAGEVVRVPTRAAAGIDEFSKGMFRRMQMNALAYRISRSIPENRLADTGKTRDEIYRELSQINLGQVSPENNPLWRERIKETGAAGVEIIADIEDFAKAAVFQQKLGSLGNKLLAARKEYPLLTLVLPFIKTPINIFKDAASYTPAGVLPGMRGFTGLKKEEAWARAVLGTSIASIVYHNVVGGNITGAYPSDEGRREAMMAAGIPEFSMKIGDRWYSYARIEPLASVLGVFADGTELLFDAFNNDDPKKMESLGKDMAGAIVKNLASKTFLEGLSNALMAIVDYPRYGEAFLNSYANLLVPGAIAQVARAQDPVQRDVDNFMDGIANRIPGLRQELPIRFDVLGQPKANPAYEFGVFGIASKKDEISPLQEAVKQYGISIGKPSRTLKNVELNTIDYEKYSKLSGDFISRQLNAIISDPSFQNLPKERKKVLLEQAAEKSRRNASNQFHAEKMQTDPEYYAEFIRQRRLKRGLPTE